MKDNHSPQEKLETAILTAYLWFAKQFAKAVFLTLETLDFLNRIVESVKQILGI